MRAKQKDLRNRKGHCPVCGLHRYLTGKGNICRPCAHPVMTCPKCGTHAKLPIAGICGTCYQDDRGRISIKKYRSKSTFASSYNGYLFELYIKAIERHPKIEGAHAICVKYLVSVFESNPIPTIKSWSQIYDLAKKYPLPSGRKAKSCPWNKIGHMLFELGLLVPKAEDLCRQIENHLFHLGKNDEPSVREFIKYLANSNRAQSTQVGHLNSLLMLHRSLIKKDPNLNLLSANSALLESYLNGLSLWSRRAGYQHFSQFYRFCKSKKWIFVHPMAEIKAPPKRQSRVEILCERDLKKVIQFIKTPSNPPELALILALVLFYGFTPGEIAHTQIKVHNDELILILRRKPLTHGKKSYSRDAQIRLATKPVWFLALQKRFYHQWLDHFQNIKNNNPVPLLVTNNFSHLGHRLTQTYICKIVARATQLATGNVIPYRILRQTCGHLQTNMSDASALSRLGWSPSYSFQYTWMPRAYFSPNPKTQESVE